MFFELDVGHDLHYEVKRRVQLSKLKKCAFFGLGLIKLPIVDSFKIVFDLLGPLVLLGLHPAVNNSHDLVELFALLVLLLLLGGQ